MNNLSKVLVGLGAAGTISIGGYFLVQNLNLPTNVRESLISKGFRILDLTESEEGSKDYKEWNDKITAYKTAQQDQKFAGSTTIDSSDISRSIKELKKNCRDILQVSIGSQDLESKETKAERWCAVK